MIVHECDQYSEIWEMLRRGIPTASAMDRVVKPGMGKLYKCGICETEFPRPRKRCDKCEVPLQTIAVVKPSDQQDKYMYELIYQSWCGVTIQRPPNGDMDRGHELEARAVADYEFLSGNDTQPVGFVTTDDGLIGASPDRFVGTDGLLEAKTSKPELHIRYLVTPGALTQDHWVQLQSQLLVCSDRKWVDIIGYSELPDGSALPSVIERVERDEAYISGMNDILVAFVTRLHRTRAELIAQYGEFAPKVAAAVVDSFVDEMLRQEANK